MAEFKYLDENGVKVIAGKINDVTEELSNVKSTLKENAEADAELAEKVFASVEYVSNENEKKIVFKNEKGEEKGSIDATAFVKDGMINSVEVKDGKLVITFNEDGKEEPIELNLVDIFNPENYYTKEEADAKFQEVGDYAEYTPFNYKGEQRKSIVLNEGDTISSLGVNFGTVKTYEGLFYEEENAESGLMPVLEVGGTKGALVLNTCESVVKVEVVENGRRQQHAIATVDDFKAIDVSFIESLFAEPEVKE